MGYLDQIKGLFNSLKEKGAEYAGIAADKTKDAARIAKLTMEMNTEKENLKKAYLELGKTYFEENRASAEGLFAQLCEEVAAVSGRIDGIQAELDGLKDSFKTAPDASFEKVVSADEEADITVEVTEEPCECCEKETCENCDVKAEEPCCCEGEEKTEESCCCEGEEKTEESCCCEGTEKPEE